MAIAGPASAHDTYQLRGVDMMTPPTSMTRVGLAQDSSWVLWRARRIQTTLVAHIGLGMVSVVW